MGYRKFINDSGHLRRVMITDEMGDTHRVNIIDTRGRIIAWKEHCSLAQAEAHALDLVTFGSAI